MTSSRCCRPDSAARRPTQAWTSPYIGAAFPDGRLCRVVPARASSTRLSLSASTPISHALNVPVSSTPMILTSRKRSSWPHVGLGYFPLRRSRMSFFTQRSAAPLPKMKALAVLSYSNPLLDGGCCLLCHWEVAVWRSWFEGSCSVGAGEVAGFASFDLQRRSCVAPQIARMPAATNPPHDTYMGMSYGPSLACHPCSTRAR